MKRIFAALIFLGCMAFPIHAQTSGNTPPPPPYCTSANAGALYTNTGTSPATVYTCSYYNLAWQWVVNPSYGGLVSYPTVPTTCSGALPVFLAGWPNTQEYVCVNGVPDAIGGAGSGVTTFAAPSASWPTWLVPTVTTPDTTPSLAVTASTIPVNAGGTGATTAAEALANLDGAALTGATFTGPVSAPQIGPIWVADAYPGSDCGAKINNAVLASGGIGGTILVGAGCGYTISTQVNLMPTTTYGLPIALQFISAGTWVMSAPIVVGTVGGHGGSISGPPSGEIYGPVTLQAAPNYTAICPASTGGFTYSALICARSLASLTNILIEGNKTNQPSSVITSYTTGSGIVTLQGANTFIAGQAVYFSIASGPTFLNTELPRYTVLSSGLSASQFEVAYPGATGSGSATGMAAASIQDVLVQNARDIKIHDATLWNASQDGLHVTSDFYPGVTASEALSLNQIVFMYSMPGNLGQLYQVTVAGTGTSTYPGYPSGTCTATLNSTCTWGSATLKNIGADYSSFSGNGTVGPNVFFLQNGRDGFFTERNVDWTVSGTVQFENSGRDGFHGEDVSAYRFGMDDWGANGRYGFYTAVVNAGCSYGGGAAFDFIIGSQFGANGYLPGSWSGVGGDIYVNGSAATAQSFCGTPSTYALAGSMTIIGNQFIESGGTANKNNSIEFIDAGNNNLTSNNWNGTLGSPEYNYLVASSYSLLTGSARIPTIISKSITGGAGYSAPIPFLLTNGVDVADAVISPGVQTTWGDVVINGNLTVTNPTSVSPMPENYVQQDQSLGTSPWTVAHAGSGVNPIVTPCTSYPACNDPFGNSGTGVYTVGFNLGGGGITSSSVLAQPLVPPGGATSGIRKVYLKAASGTPTIILAGEPTGCSTSMPITTAWTQVTLYCSTSGSSDEFAIETVGTLAPDITTIEVWDPCATYNNGQCVSPAGVPIGTTTAAKDYTKFTPLDLGLILGDPFTAAPTPLSGLHGSDAYIQTSDGTGPSGNAAVYDASGGLTDGGVFTNGVWPVTSPAVTCTSGTLTTYTSSLSVASVGKIRFISLTIHDTTNGSCFGNFIFTLPFTSATAASPSCKETVVTGLGGGIDIESGSSTAVLNLSNGGSPAVSGYNIVCSGVAQSQ